MVSNVYITQTKGKELKEVIIVCKIANPFISQIWKKQDMISTSYHL
jgi:hypothetical protein